MNTILSQVYRSLYVFTIFLIFILFPCHQGKAFAYYGVPIGLNTKGAHLAGSTRINTGFGISATGDLNRDHSHGRNLVEMLPVNFLSFTAGINRDEVNLNWSVEEKPNSVRFVIENS